MTKPAKTITFAQLNGVLNQRHDGGRLSNAVDNAGQTVFLPFMLCHKEMRAQVSAMAKQAGLNWQQQEIDAFFSTGMQYASAMFSGELKRPGKVTVDELHTTLSLYHHLQPESEAGVKQGVERTLTELKLPIMPIEDVAASLPALQKAMKRTTAQLRGGGQGKAV